MRFNVDRICELAGIGAASGGLLSEGAAPAKAPVAPAAKAPAPKALPAPAAKPASGKAPVEKMAEYDDVLPGEYYSYEEEGGDLDPEDVYDIDEDDASYVTTPGDILEDESVYEIDEMELAEALIGMRQHRLEEASVRDTVRDEIQRALADKSGAWVYGSNRPTASGFGHVSRGGFGIGFKR